MAISTGLYQATNTSVALFNAWAQAISTAFSTFGWVQTTDTGQANWTTNVTIPAANTFQYQCWMTNDALSSTGYPIVVKIFCGSSNNGPPYPTMYMQAGFGTVPGGGVTTTFAAITNLITMNSGNWDATYNGAYECDFSGDSGRFQMVLWRGLVNSMFSIERGLSSSGVPTGDYLVGLSGGYSLYNATEASVLTYAPEQQILFTPGNSIWGAGSPVLGPEYNWTVLQTGASSAIVNGQMGIGLVFPYTGAGFGNPLMGAVCIKQGDLLDNVSFTTSMYGATHTYLTVSNSYNSTMVSRAASNGQTSFSVGTNSMAIRYE